MIYKVQDAGSPTSLAPEKALTAHTKAPAVGAAPPKAPEAPPKAPKAPPKAPEAPGKATKAHTKARPALANQRQARSRTTASSESASTATVALVEQVGATASTTPKPITPGTTIKNRQVMTQTLLPSSTIPKCFPGGFMHMAPFQFIFTIAKNGIKLSDNTWSEGKDDNSTAHNKARDVWNFMNAVAGQKPKGGGDTYRQTWKTWKKLDSADRDYKNNLERLQKCMSEVQRLAFEDLKTRAEGVWCKMASSYAKTPKAHSDGNLQHPGENKDAAQNHCKR